MSTLGSLSLSATHHGDTYTLYGLQVYALCNGQALLRSSYPDLSDLWPVGAYGSSVSEIHLPDLGASDGYFLRGADFNRGVDTNVSTRIALSGTFPVTSGVGSLQEGNFATHTHPQGSQNSANRSSFGSDGNCCYPNNVTTFNTGDAISISGPTSLGAASSSAFDLAHMKVFPYILSNF